MRSAPLCVGRANRIGRLAVVGVVSVVTVFVLLVSTEVTGQAPVAASCLTQDGASPVSHARNRSQEQGPRGPSSPWFGVPMTPPKEAAIGVLMGTVPEPTYFQVTWADATSSVEPETALFPTPEPLMLPTLGPLTWPAVFAVSQDCALVFGHRGWGWTPIAHPRLRNHIPKVSALRRIRRKGERAHVPIKTPDGVVLNPLPLDGRLATGSPAAIAGYGR